MNYKSWIIDDLRSLERLRYSIPSMETELETIEAECTAIRATDYDRIPGGSGGQEEHLLSAIARKDALRANLKATSAKVKLLENLLNALPDDERRVLELMHVSPGSHAVARLCEELGYESAQIYRVKDRALLHLAQLRFGAGYQP